MSLAFKNRRFVPALDYEDPVKEKGPWLSPKMFTDKTKKQLRLLVEGNIGAPVSDSELFSGGYEMFEDICEVMLEWLILKHC
jgi:hypothetical protein